jgi:hypothetical protein
MEFVSGPIGPLVPNFDVHVAQDLNHSPTPQEWECLKNFFSSLRHSAIDCDYFMVGQLLFVHRCNHTIFFAMYPDGASTVMRIRRGAHHEYTD